MADQYGTYGDQDMQSRRIPTREESNANPGFLKRLALSMMNNPTAGADPAVMGLVMKNPANVSKLAEIIAKNLPEGAGPFEKAVTYFAAKYPKLAAKIGRIQQRNLPGGTHGEYLTSQGEHPSIVNVNRSIDIDDAVKTLGHEATHNIQDVRSQRVPVEASYRTPRPGKPSPSDPTYGALLHDPGRAVPQPNYGMSGPTLGRTEQGPYKAPLGAKTPYEKANDLYGYTLNPYEVQARQGGRTAYSGYDDFLRKRAGQLSEGQPGAYEPYLDPFETLINPTKPAP